MAGTTLNGGSSCKNCGSFKDADTCKDYGLQVLVPRSRTHWVSLKERFGDDYFNKAMTGVYAPIKGDYRYVAMNSYDGMPEAGYKALDGGNWWFRPTKYGEPNGNYDSGNWLKVWKTGVGNVDNMEFDDHNSKTNSVKYICSENHETKTTLYLAPPTGTVKRLLLPIFSCCPLLSPVANLLDVFDCSCRHCCHPDQQKSHTRIIYCECEQRKNCTGGGARWHQIHHRIKSLQRRERMQCRDQC